MYIRAQARHTVIKRMLFPTISPSTKKSPISAPQHPFCRLPFSQFLLLLLQKWQRKSEELNSIQTALQIWDFQATPVWSSSVFVTQMMNVLKILKIWFILLGLWPTHTHWTCCLRPVFVTSGSSLSTTLTSVSNAFTDFWGLTYFLSKFYQTNQQVSISLLSKIMDFLKVLIEKYLLLWGMNDD